MAGTDTSRKKIIAMFLTAIVLSVGFSTAPTMAKTVEGGNVSTSDVPSDTGTYLPDATIDGATDSTIEVAYNAEQLIADGKVTQEELTVEVRIGTHVETVNAPNQKGQVEVTIPAGALGGGSHHAYATLTNGKSYPDKESWGRSSAVVTEQTSVTISDYALSDSTIYKSGNVDVEMTLHNPGSSSDTIDLGVYKKPSDFDAPMSLTYPESSSPLKQVTVDPGATKTVTLTRTFDTVGTKDVAVNTQPSKQLTVENPLTVVDYTLQSETASIGEDVAIEVTLENPTNSEVTDKIPLYEGYETDSGMQKYSLAHDNAATLQAGETTTKTAIVQFDRAETKQITAGDGNGFSSIEITNPLEVDSYSLDATDVEIGESFTVTATVTNPTDRTITAPVPAYRKTPWSDAEKSKLYLKNRDQATVTLDAGNSETVTFQHSFENDGERTITFGDQPYTTVTVTDPLEYTLDGISKRVVQPGETITITQSITNPTDHEVQYNLYIGGERISGSLASGATETKQATVSFEEEGRQRIWVSGTDVMREVVVTSDTSVKDASTFEISDVHDFTAVPNEEVTLYANVTNTGEETGVRAVPVFLDGSQVGSDLVYSAPGESEWVFVRANAPETPGTYDVKIGGQTATLTVREPVVESVQIEHVGGTTPDKLPQVDASLTSRGSIDVAVRNRTGGLGLTSMGVDKTTEFRITMVVKNYEPRTVISSGRNLDWKTESIDGTEKTRVTVTLSPSELNFMQGAPRIENWDTLSDAEDRATFGIQTAVLLQVDNAEGKSILGTEADNLKGLSVSTDAQRFRAPEYHQGTDDQAPRLEIPLAAPHLTVDGEVNDGFYEAFLPNALLDEWGVDSKDDLTAAYSGAEDTQFSVTETEKGMVISLDLHYSSGTVTISPEASSPPPGGGAPSPAPTTKKTTTTTSVSSSPTVTTISTTTETTTDETETQAPLTDSSETATESSSLTTRTTAENSGGTPGFGLQSVFVALVVTTVLFGRRR